MEKKKILIVDDNRAMRAFLSRLLEKEGHDVWMAHDGYHALKYVFREQPDIMFIDFFMPKIDGGLLCQMVRKMPQMKNSYLVIISAALAEMDFDCQKVGADACIAKGPFGQMSKHVLESVREAGTSGRESCPKPILGLDPCQEASVHPRQMTKELLSMKRHLESVLDSLRTGVLELNANIIVYANAYAESIFGMKKEDLMARDFVELFDPRERNRIRALANGEAGKSSAIPTDDPVSLHGRQLSIEMNARKAGGASAIIQITDITDQNERVFERYRTQNAFVLSDLAQRTARLLEVQIAGIGRSCQKLLETIDRKGPTFKQIEVIDQHSREMGTIGNQLSRIAHAETLTRAHGPLPLEKGTETILLIDCKKLLCHVNRRMIEELGYKALVAKTVKSALLKYESRAKKKYNNIDLVIVNNEPSEMDTDGLVQGLKQIDPEVKILFSGNPPPFKASIWRPPGQSSGVVASPFDVYQVAAEIRKALPGSKPQ
ncbi:MAG: response regulator [Desulfobacterales bacterium]|nr:response regulator [Desulfobacterales bacterium]